jgi:hypothetical protein
MALWKVSEIHLSLGDLPAEHTGSIPAHAFALLIVTFFWVAGSKGTFSPFIHHKACGRTLGKLLQKNMEETICIFFNMRRMRRT